MSLCFEPFYPACRIIKGQHQTGDILPEKTEIRLAFGKSFFKLVNKYLRRDYRKIELIPDRVLYHALRQKLCMLIGDTKLTAVFSPAEIRQNHSNIKNNIHRSAVLRKKSTYPPSAVTGSLRRKNIHTETAHK